MFKKGDKVILPSNSDIDPEEDNPVHTHYPDVMGTIVQIQPSIFTPSELVYFVVWSNGEDNCYNAKHLAHFADDDPVAPVKIPKEKSNNLTF